MLVAGAAALASAISAALLIEGRKPQEKTRQASKGIQTLDA
jgi:hypothetical protein